LNHPNIAVVHSIQVDKPSGLTGICMSYVGRLTLSNILDKLWESGTYPKPLSVCGKADQLLALGASSNERFPREPFLVRIAYIAERLADALAYAEEQGVVHGDLKPSNILLTSAGEPVLVDFNLSRQPTDAPRQFGGTPPYMAPEVMEAFFSQVSGGELTPSFRGDQYSFGVVVYELLCGLPPHDVDFDSGRPLYVPAGTKVLDEGGDDGFFSIVQRCLSSKPEDRFENFSQLRRHIADWLARRRRRANSRRLTRRIAIGAAAAALLATGAAGYKVATRQSFNEQRLRSAMSNIQAGHYINAATELGYLYNVRKSSTLAAWTGYCFAKENVHDDAIPWMDFSLRLDGQDPHVWNNRGYSWSQRSNLRQAESDLTQALSLNSKIQAAYHNRAMVRLRKASERMEPPGPEVLADISTALDIGPETAELHLRAAHIYGYAKFCGQQNHPPIEPHIVRAIELGEPLKTFQRSTDLFSDIDLRAVAQQAQIEAPPRRKAVLVLEPTTSLASEISRFKD
jgi:serine/threonine protein kinase